MSALNWQNPRPRPFWTGYVLIAVGLAWVHPGLLVLAGGVGAILYSMTEQSS